MQNGSELLEPRTAAEAGEMLLEAAGSGRTISLDRQGGEVVVSTAAMTRVIEHEATDLTCIVEPGLRLSQLDAVLEPHGQRFALDPPGNPTVGECILNGLSGPRRHCFGAIRDLILGVTIVLVDGTVASSGGKVVKNVAGYDLAKLFCGSRGGLGLVVRAALRLHPRAEQAATAEVAVNQPREASDAVRALQRATLIPSALELLWPGRLLVMIEGSRRVVATQLAEAERVVGASEVRVDPWDEVRTQQARASGTLAFAPGELTDVLSQENSALVRPVLGIAYVERPVRREISPALHALHERVRRVFDPQGVLVD